MESKVEYRGHVVVIPYPSQGHINPLLQFAKRLASKGLKATLATTYYTVSSIRVPTVAVEPISDGFDGSGYSQASNEEAFLESFKTVGSRTLSELIKKFENSDSPVNCIVYDSFLIWALDVARQHGIYGAPFFTNSAAVSSIFCLIHHGLLTLPVKSENMPLMIDGIPPLGYSDLPTFLKTPEAYPAYLSMKVNQYSNLKLADWIFCNTFDKLEGKEAKAALELWPGKLIGPMIPSLYLDGRIADDKGYGASLWKPLSDECMKWLDSKPRTSVVYVSFGSMVVLSTTQMEELAWGLKECGWHFLWVVKETERSKLPIGFLESIQEKGLFVTWCNQLEVLAHQSVGCFVTHCGWNSTLEGLSLGVPMVGVAKWADQSTNAKFIDVWGVGVRAKDDDKGIVSREELERCIQAVMDGKPSEEIKKNARKWRESAKEAISEGGSSDKNIDDFVAYLKSGKKK